MSAAVPTTPAVEVAVSRQDVLLPAAAAELLRRGECSLAEAAEFLGLAVDQRGWAGSTAHAMAKRYRERVARLMFDEHGRPRPYDPVELIPRMRSGEWVEIANSKAGNIVCDTRYLVAMRYPSLGMPR